MEEEWRPVREFPDYYDISSMGRLRRNNPYRPSHANKIRKHQFSNNGYVMYMLSIRQKPIMRSAHRMVADAFLGPIPDGMQVNHKNGNKTDPRVENLEIVTNGENRAHSYRVLGIKPNRAPLGIHNRNAKLTWEQVQDIRHKYRNGLASYSVLAREHSVTKQSIASIVKGKTRREA